MLVTNRAFPHFIRARFAPNLRVPPALTLGRKKLETLPTSATLVAHEDRTRYDA